MSESEIRELWNFVLWKLFLFESRQFSARMPFLSEYLSSLRSARGCMADSYTVFVGVRLAHLAAVGSRLLTNVCVVPGSKYHSQCRNPFLSEDVSLASLRSARRGFV